MRRGFRCLSASVFFAGTGGRANAVVDRLAQQSVPGFAFACITDDAQVATTHPHILVNEQLFEADHAKEASRMLEDSASPLNETFAEASRSDVVFVVADLAETLSGASPVFANLFRTQGALTIGVALMPLAFGGHILSSKALKGLRALKRECDNVIVFDTSNLSRQEGLQAANFLELHETFLDMCAHNLRSLAVPLTRKGDLLRISLSSCRRLFARENDKARETRLVCAQMQSDLNGGIDRGRAVLQRALTDEFFPIDDVSSCFGCLIAVDAAKDLAYSEIEHVFSVEQFMSEKATIVQGLHYGDVAGLQVTLAVVGDGVQSAEDKELERLENEEAQNKKYDIVGTLWKKLKDWF